MPLVLPAMHTVGEPTGLPTNQRQSTTASSWRMTISRAAIATAWAALESRVQEAADGVDVDDLDDVVIATNVTLQDLENVPREWLDGLKIELRVDGTLVAVSIASEQSSYVAQRVWQQVYDYVGETWGLRAALYRPMKVGDRLMAADVQLARVSLDIGAFVSLAAFEIEAPGRTGPQMIEYASAILTTFAQVECVVCFKIYAPRAAFLAVQQLRIPALAIVFRRGTTDREIAFRGRQLRLVRIEQMLSFGNSGIDESALRAFTTGSQQHCALLENPFTLTDLVHLIDGPLAFPDAFEVGNMEATLPRALVAAQATAAAFSVSMEMPLSPIRIDLPCVFVAAVIGWALGPRTGKRGILEADAGRYPVGVHGQAEEATVVSRVVAHVRRVSWRVARWVARRGFMPWLLAHVAEVTAALRAADDYDDEDNDGAA